MEYVAPERMDARALSAVQLKQLEAAAQQAILEYPLKGASLEFLAYHSNTSFKVKIEGIDRFVLRVGMPQEEFAADIPTEITWLHAVARGSGVPTVEPVSNFKGDYVTNVFLPGESLPRRCVLFKWLDGKPLAESISTARYRALGEISARLHEFGEHWIPPAGLHPLAWDRVFYFPGEPVVLFDADYSSVVNKDAAEIFRAVAEIGDREISVLQLLVRPMYVHGDLHMRNLMVSDTLITVYDFEDVMLAAPLQDIAISLYYGRTRADYQDLVKAFRNGYESARQWPNDEQLGTLMAARSLMLANRALRTSTAPRSFIDRVTTDLKAYLSK